MLKKALSGLILRYENELEVTVGDVVDEVERLAEKYPDAELAGIVAQIRSEGKEELDVWGIRGDLDSAEGEFIKIIRAMAAKPVSHLNEAVSSTDDWDYSIINKVMANREPYPAILIDKVIGAREHELPLLLHAGYRLQGDVYVPNP